MIPVMGLSLVSIECRGFYNKPIEIFKISGITLLGGLLWVVALLDFRVYVSIRVLLYLKCCISESVFLLTVSLDNILAP